jgi:hypothetical protein
MRLNALAIVCALATLAGAEGCDRVDSAVREGALADSIQRDEGAINVLQDVAWWLGQCGEHCDLVATRAALGRRYRVDVQADGETLDVVIPGGLGVVEIKYDHGTRIKSVRREGHKLGAPQTGAGL